MSTGPDLSYVCGSGARPLVHRTVGGVLDEAAESWGERTALIVRAQNLRLSYRELAERSEGLAASFLALGLAPGDRIGIWSSNNSEWVLTQFAAARAGLILVTINPGYRAGELEYALNKVGCRALVMAECFRSTRYVEMVRELAPEVDSCEVGDLQAARLPQLRVVVRLGAARERGFLRFADLADLGSAADRVRVRELKSVIQADDATNIQFTSGTTGAPRGATLTHSNIVNNALQVGDRIGLTPDDRLCLPVPLYHCFGMVMGVLACATHGSTMVLPGEWFEPKSVLETVAREGCTALYGVPTMFIAELEHPDFGHYDLTTLRTGIMAGAPCPMEVMRRVMRDMHLEEITICYGMTETSPVSFQSDIDDPIEKRVSTVGRVQPFVEAKVVDANGRTVPRGERGELLTRGYLVMLGYWDDPERTDEAIDEARWMHTGDLATIDTDGYCTIVGRAKDMIIRGGENVYPREIEEFLFTHPKVQSVQVFGVPDERYGERVCAWIRLQPGVSCDTAEIVEYCREKIAHYKVPSFVEFVEEFPMTVTGKVQKFVMREQMVARLRHRRGP
jgi:fatty-acyl-CoA synthase